MKINKNIHEKMVFVGISGIFKDFQLSDLRKQKQRKNVFKLGKTTGIKTCSIEKKL